MRRKPNAKLLLVTFGLLVVAGLCVHLLHQEQSIRNAHALLEQANRAVAKGDLDGAMLHYSHFLATVPGDVEAQQKYVELLDKRAVSYADQSRLVLRMEEVLRSKPDQHALRLRLVHNLIAIDRVDEAAGHIAKLMDTGLDRAELLHMLGWCQEARKDYLKAADSFQRAIKIDPKRIDSHLLLAEVHQQLQQDQEAGEVLDALVKANPDNPRAWLARSRRQQSERNDALAEQDLLAARKLAPGDLGVVLAWADWLQAKGDHAGAAKTLDDGRKAHPRELSLYKASASLLLRGGQRAAAIEVLRDGLARLPRVFELLVLYADLLIDEKQYGAAEAKIQELQDAGLAPALPRYLQARIGVAQGKWAESVTHLERVRLELGPKSEWSSRVDAMLGYCYQQMGDLEHALLSYRRAVNAEPNWTAARVGLGSALLEQRRLGEAIDELDAVKARPDAPANLRLLLARARLYQQLRLQEKERTWNEIEADLAAAIKANPASLEPAVLQAEVLAVRRQFGPARELLEARKKSQPDEIVVWCALADLAVLEGRWDAAAGALADAEKKFGDRLEVRLAKIRLHGSRATPDDRDALDRLADQLPDTPLEQRTRLWRELADTWRRLGDDDRAAQRWRDIAQEQPQDLRSRFWLLEAALRRNQGESARKLIAELRKLEGEQGVHWRYGTLALLVQEAKGSQRKLADVRRSLDELLERQRDWPRLHLLAASIDEREGQYQKAIQHYLDAFKFGETSPRVLQRLLQLLVDRHEFLQAEEMIASYLPRMPLDRDLSRVAAEVAAGNLNAPEARQRAAAAVTLPSRDFRDHLWMARIRQSIGDLAEAEQALRTALVSAEHAPEVWLALVEHLMLAKQPDAAAKTLELAKAKLKERGLEARVPLLTARGHEILRQHDLAEQAYRLALAERPDDFVLAAFAADFFRHADQRDEARRLYERLIDPELSAPSESVLVARRHLATLLAPPGQAVERRKALELIDANIRLQGETVADERARLYVVGSSDVDRPGAVAKFQASLKRQEPTGAERALLADLFGSLNRNQDARGELEKALSSSLPPHQQAFYLARLARVLAKLDDFAEAEATVARLETLEPAHPRTREVRAAVQKAKALAAP